MAISPTGILPEELMFPAKLNDVILFLEKIPIPGDQKDQIFFGWARTVGVKISGAQRARVRQSGVDQ